MVSAAVIDDLEVPARRPAQRRVDLSKIRPHRLESLPFQATHKLMQQALAELVEELGFRIVSVDSIGGLKVETAVGLLRLNVDPPSSDAGSEAWCYWCFEDREVASRDPRVTDLKSSGFFNGKCNFYDYSVPRLYASIRERLGRFKS